MLSLLRLDFLSAHQQRKLESDPVYLTPFIQRKLESDPVYLDPVYLTLFIRRFAA